MAQDRQRKEKKGQFECTLPPSSAVNETRLPPTRLPTLRPVRVPAFDLESEGKKLEIHAYGDVNFSNEWVLNDLFACNGTQSWENSQNTFRH